MTQTLASGDLPQSKYGTLPGFTARPMLMPMERIFGLLCGPPGEGKTTFIQSFADGFTFNLDKSSTSQWVRGTVWPGIDDEGQTVDQQGKVNLSWGRLVDIKNILVQMSEADADRPATIFVDSVDALIPLLMRHLIAVNNVTYWQEMDGRRMWGILYDMIVKWCGDLLDARYGVWLVCHVVNAKVPVGEDRFAIRPELTLGDGLWKRTEWAYEMIAGIEKSIISTEREVKQEPIMRDGKEFIPKPKVVQDKKSAWIFTADSQDYPELTKKRLSIPGEIVLDPGKDGWDIVKAEYDKIRNALTP